MAVKKEFPPRFVDTTKMTPAQIDAFLDEMTEYGSVEPFTVRVVAGSAFADACLKRSPGNVRRESATTIAMYRRDMDRGAWAETGESFKFDVARRFRDGHHRAQALRGAERHVAVSVHFGMPEEANARLDQGFPRTAANVLRMTAKDVACVRAALRLRLHVNTDASLMRQVKYSAAEIAEGAIRYSESMKALAPMNPYSASMWAVLVMLHETAPRQICEFARQMRAPIGTHDLHSTVRVLRDFLAGADATGSIGTITISLKTLYAVKAFLEGRDLKKSIVRNDGEAVVAWFKRQVTRR